MSKLTYRLAAGSLVVAGIVGMVLAPNGYALSDAKTNIVRAQIGQTISVDSVTPSTLTLAITTVSGGAQTTGSTAVAVSTNDALGYNLGISASPAALTNGSNTIGASANTTWGSAASLANNTWGFAVPSGTTGLVTGSAFDATYTATSNQTTNASKFMAVPTSSLVVRNVTSGPVAGDSTTFWFSAKADTTKPSGPYDSTITYTATAN